MLKKQGWHLLSLMVLLAGVALIAADDFLMGQLWGISTKFWFWLALGVPIVHQIVVPVIWRGSFIISG